MAHIHVLAPDVVNKIADETYPMILRGLTADPEDKDAHS